MLPWAHQANPANGLIMLTLACKQLKPPKQNDNTVQVLESENETFDVVASLTTVTWRSASIVSKKNINKISQ